MNGAGVQLWGWDSANSVWVKVLVNSAGKLIIDPSEIFENPPTNGETAKAPQSDWAYDHWKDPNAHHARLHDHSNALDGSPIAAAGIPNIGARVYSNANQSIPNLVWTALNFNSERWDTDTIHDTVTNNSRLTCKTAGVYLIASNVWFVAGGTAAERLARIIINGVTIIAEDGVPSSNKDELIDTSTIWNMAVNDYAEAVVYQSSGGNLNIRASSAFTPEFMMQRIG